MSQPRIQPTQMGYAVVCPYNKQFTPELKTYVPAQDRNWSQSGKCWYVAPVHRETLIRIINQVYGVLLDPQPLTMKPAPVVTKEFRIDYLGQCKERDNGVSSSSGSVNDEWLCVLPEEALRAWFNQTTTQTAPGAKPTLYSLLGVTETALAVDLKSAYRRLARQWHPDVCKEEGATEMFQKIEQAYKRLADPLARRKYDAGLAMEAQTTTRIGSDYDPWGTLVMPNSLYGYQPPLRCGIVRAEWQAWLGRYTALKILSWADITNSLGQIAVPMWRKGDDKFRTQWVTP